MSLDQLIVRALPEASASEREGLIALGAASISGRPARKLKTRVRPGGLVEIQSDLPAPPLDESSSSWRVLVPALPWRVGTLDGPRGKGGGIAFEERIEQNGVAELLVQGAGEDVRAGLAEAGHPILGDVRAGGILVAGGLRLAVAMDEAPAVWWPREPVFPERSGDEGFRLEVSQATSRILSRGHPWILRDEETGDPGRFALGTRVDVVGPAGEELGAAHVEGTGRVTARIWSPPGAPSASVEARVAAAMGRRKQLLESPDTDAVRLVHGEADRLPGLFVDRLGPLLRVLVTSAGTGSYRTRALDAIVRALAPQLGGDPPVVEVLHLRDRPPGALECTRLVRGDRGVAEAKVFVRERGATFRVDPGLDRPHRASPGVGLYLDQRDNRERLLRSATGGRLLNLFAHTGAFSVAWLAAGHAEAVSVDLSAGYLRWLEENLTLNGIDLARHRSVKQDGRRYLETLPAEERFDAIVLDPPTAASAGRRFWSVAKELPSLVAGALSHLSPGGVLLVSRNDRRRSELRDLVARAAKRKGMPLDVQPAPAGVDFPRLSGFPEGDPFSAVVGTLSSR